jgi:hypothetical protein
VNGGSTVCCHVRGLTNLAGLCLVTGTVSGAAAGAWVSILGHCQRRRSLCRPRRRRNPLPLAHERRELCRARAAGSYCSRAQSILTPPCVNHGLHGGGGRSPVPNSFGSRRTYRFIHTILIYSYTRSRSSISTHPTSYSQSLEVPLELVGGPLFNETPRRPTTKARGTCRAVPCPTHSSGCRARRGDGRHR